MKVYKASFTAAYEGVGEIVQCSLQQRMVLHDIIQQQFRLFFALPASLGFSCCSLTDSVRRGLVFKILRFKRFVVLRVKLKGLSKQQDIEFFSMQNTTKHINATSRISMRSNQLNVNTTVCEV